MAEPKIAHNQSCSGFKEAVCIDAARIFDSCSDKDCLSDLQVHFTDCVQPIIDQAINVKCKNVEILTVYLDVEPVSFNRGFYSVDMTYFFLVEAAVYTASVCTPQCVTGIATFSKKIILYGSEGEIKTFNSDDNYECNLVHHDTNNLPTATLQVAEPICLGCSLQECHHHHCPITLPEHICCKFEGDFSCVHPQKAFFITIGLFSIVQLKRNVQMLVPAYDYCIPDKECISSNPDDPCDLFKKIKFPTDAFFPPKLCHDESCCD